MDYSTRLLYKDKMKMHPEIYNSNIPFEHKIWLQEHLDLEHKGNFKSLLFSMMEYAILPEIEDYENAAIIRDELKYLNNMR